MDEVRNRVSQEILDENSKEKNAFISWYIDAKPLDKFIYYAGLHLHETMGAIRVRNEAWKFAVEGKVYLFHMKDNSTKNNWFFIAQKASRRIPHLNPKPKG